MTLKVRILQSLRRLLIILVGLTMTWFSEKMLISNICIGGLKPNLSKKSWTVSNVHAATCTTYSLCNVAMERVCNCDECWGIPSGCNFDWLRLVSRLQMCDRKVIDGSRMFILRKTDWMKYLFGDIINTFFSYLRRTVPLCLTGFICLTIAASVKVEFT